MTILNILIPMAGKGSRFAVEGYDLPKPLIDVNGIPMIQLVIENIKPKIPHHFIFICLEDHVSKHNIDKFLLSIEPTAKIVLVNQVTGGAAETAMLASQSVDQNMPLLIANSDQYLNFDINHYINFLEASLSDANIMTMNATGEKWSFIKKKGQLVSEVAEKKEISTEATVGIYFFKHGRDFFRYAKNMIEIKDKTLGEYYVAMVYNYLIRAGLAVDSYNVGNVEDRVYGLGTPSDLRLYLKVRG